MITEKIKTFADVCEALGTTEQEFEAAFAQLPDRFKEAAKAQKLVMLAEVLNESWKPDWTDSNGKYYPWFDLDGEDENGSSGAFVFGDYCYCNRSLSDVGSRLVYKNRELAEYAGKQFIDLYRDFFVKE